MSAPPQPPDRALTKRNVRPFRWAIGQKSSAALFTAAKLTGSAHPPPAPRREDQKWRPPAPPAPPAPRGEYQISSPPAPPAGPDAKYRMSSRWATKGQPSRAAEFSAACV